MRKLRGEDGGKYMIVNANALCLPIASKSVQCVVTSPPYFGLRDYGTDGQLGLEHTPEEFVANLVLVFREVWRVLKDDGVIWVNLGDSYAGSGEGGGGNRKGNEHGQHDSMIGKRMVIDKSKRNSTRWGGGNVPASGDLKPKDLIGIPWLVAFALRADGWYLRSDIIWSKPNPMPESVTDRPTKSHEYLFLLTKSARYFYDAEAIKEPYIEPQKNATNSKICGMRTGGHGSLGKPRSEFYSNGGRNKRSVWEITTQPTSYAHFATYPEKLVEPCILAGSRPGDYVLDPFSGSGTTGMVAIRHGRKYIGTELNFKYISEISPRRLTVQPMLQEVNHA